MQGLFKCPHRYTTKNQKGTEFLELAICLPLVIGFLFGMFDTARLCLGASAVRTGVYQAARRAVGLQRNPGAIFSTSMENRDEIYASELDYMSTYPWKEYPEDNTPVRYISYSDTKYFPSTLFKAEATAMAYAYHIAYNTFGELKWPCQDAPSCILCRPLRKSSKTENIFCVDDGENNCASYSVRFLGLECTLDVPITSTIIAFGWLPEYLPITSRVYLPVDNYSKVQFDYK